MDKICAILDRTISWVNLADRAPIVWAASERTRVNTNVRPLLEFGFQSDGDKVDVAVGDKQAVSVAGTLLIMNAHFGNRARPSSSWNYWCVSLDTEGKSSFDDIAEGPMLFSSRIRDQRAVVRAYKRVSAEYGRTMLWHDIRLKIELLGFLLVLRENVPDSAESRPAYSAPVEAALQLIHSRYDNPDMHAGDLARAAGVSPAHLIRVFGRETGTPPMKYLTQLRIFHARQKLIRSNLHIGEIAYSVGFKDRLHFSRVFKSRTGTSPREFRRDHGM